MHLACYNSFPCFQIGVIPLGFVCQRHLSFNRLSGDFLLFLFADFTQP